MFANSCLRAVGPSHVYYNPGEHLLSPWEAAGCQPAERQGWASASGSGRQPAGAAGAPSRLGAVWALCRCLCRARRQPPAPPQVTVALSMEELARRKKVLARSALASRSFSSPHGELDAHRLCQALEKVSQKRNQSLEGQLDELGPRAQRLQPSAVESSVCWLWGTRVAATELGSPPS